MISVTLCSDVYVGAVVDTVVAFVVVVFGGAVFATDVVVVFLVVVALVVSAFELSLDLGISIAPSISCSS